MVVIRIGSERNLFPNLFSSRVYTAGDADAPTSPDSDGDMNLCPDIELECDQDQGQRWRNNLKNT